MYSHQFRGAGDSSAAAAGDTSHTTFNEACAVLQHMSRTELQNLMDDNDALNQFIDSLDMVKKLQGEKDGLLVSNASLAEYNLSLEPRLISCRGELAEVYRKAVNLQKTHDNNTLRLDSAAVHTSPETTLALLQTELAKVEEESEKLAEAFTSAGPISDPEAFIDHYVSLRTLTHLRRIKADKLAEMIRNPRAAQESATSAAPLMASAAPSADRAAAPPPIPARQAPYPPVASGYGAAPPVAGGWPQSSPYPPIGASNGWAQYPGSAVPQPTPPMSYMYR